MRGGNSSGVSHSQKETKGFWHAYAEGRQLFCLLAPSARECILLTRDDTRRDSWLHSLPLLSSDFCRRGAKRTHRTRTISRSNHGEDSGMLATRNTFARHVSGLIVNPESRRAAYRHCRKVLVSISRAITRRHTREGGKDA